jgi:hypothetical protein
MSEAENESPDLTTLDREALARMVGKLQGERAAWEQTAQQHARNEDYYRGIVQDIGRMLGPEAYISDDGSIQDEVLCAKVTELVATLKQHDQRLQILCGELCAVGAEGVSKASTAAIEIQDRIEGLEADNTHLRAALAQVSDAVKEVGAIYWGSADMDTEASQVIIWCNSKAKAKTLTEIVKQLKADSTASDLAAIVAASATDNEPEPGTAAWHVARMGTWTDTPHPEGQCDQAILTKRDGVYVCGQCGKVPNSSVEAAAEGQEAGDGKG